VGVVVTHGAIEFGEYLDAANLGNLAAQAVYHVGQLLADSGGGGGLAVGAGHHRHGGKGYRHIRQ